MISDRDVHSSGISGAGRSRSVSHVRGQQLIGRVVGGCVLERLLGYGGSSAVFLARQQAPERQVAVKIFLPRTTLDRAMHEEFRQRFLREARAASKLTHPHILPIYAYGEEDGLAYIVMPYMRGGTLADHVRRHGPLSLQEAATYLRQIAAALDYAHERGCIHCDVKPANILLDGAGQALLADFGIARLVREELAEAGANGARPLTSLVGTPDYISPEQALNQYVDQRSDVYSLGATLFFMLAGRPPFLADSAIALALLHVHEPPPALCELDERVPPQIDYVLHKALAKFPEERFPSAGRLSAAFQESLQRTGTSPRVRLRVQSLTLPRWLPAVLSLKLEAIRLPQRPVRRVALAAFVLLVVVCSLTLTSNLATSHITQVAANRVASPTSQIRRVVGVPSDRLTDNPGAWPSGSTFYFANGEYHILNQSPRTSAVALYADHSFRDFHLSLDMREIRGSHDSADYYGVIFRAASDQSHYYVFEVVSWGGGAYQFLRYNGAWKVLADGALPSLLIAEGETNTIEVDAHGSTFRFFVNGHPVAPALSDTSRHALKVGSIGLCVAEQGSEIAFSHLRIGPPLF
jgi:tRNA A-37 threonylcarbamoyl transferase component Bud32